MTFAKKFRKNCIFNSFYGKRDRKQKDQGDIDEVNPKVWTD